MASTKSIDLPAGPIIAALEGDLIVAQNIKFAEAKRFTPPTPIAPWTEPRDCTKPGPICSQLEFKFPPLGAVANLDRVQSEDCLIVNVVAPANASNLPVAVWFTGGAYISGYADLQMYNTRPLARHDIVMVNVQYRLGMFGYATIPGIAPPNLGLMDQITGLKWVQKNIAAFGGDPSRVTIYGQSAGGDSVHAMMVADGTEGLFKQAVIMSAPFGIFITDKPDTEILGKTIEEKIGNDDIRTVPAARLLEVQKTVIDRRAKAGHQGPGFLLTYGAAPLGPLSETKDRLAKRAKDVRILVGWTKDDALPFVMMAPRADHLPNIPFIGTTLLHGIGKAYTWWLFSRGAQALHAQYKSLGGRSSTYCIEYYPEGSTFLACHCMELTLVFGDYEWWTQTPLLGPAERTAYERLAKTFKELFVDFITEKPLTADSYRVHKDFIYTSAGAKL